MGAVKNLFVRIGVDARAAVKGFTDASNAGAGAQRSIKKSSAQTKHSIREAFSSSVTSIKEYSAQITKTRETHQTAKQSIGQLEGEISRLKGIYDSVKNATAGLDLSKPFSELMVDAEKSLTAIESRRRKLEAELNELNNGPKAASSKKTAPIQRELEQLAEKSRFAEARLADLDRRADMLGTENIGYASAKGLDQLQQEIRETENRLQTTRMVANETGRTLKSMGVAPRLRRTVQQIGTAAAYAAGHGVGSLWRGIKKLGSAVGRKITSLPARLREIGRSASSGSGGLNRMVRSIRNLGIVSLSMRAFSFVFGRLHSIISNYISKNEELNQSVETMKDQMGQALAPAINVVIAAMQRLMPIVTKVSNGINYIFTKLFGNIKTTANAIKETTDSLYGFDQITKETDTSTASTGAGADQLADTPTWVKQLTGWLEQIKNAFMSGDWKGLGQIVGDGINSAFDALNNIDVGKKVGKFINASLTSIYSLFTTIDFSNLGDTLGKKFSEAVYTVDWGLAGRTLGEVIVALPETLSIFVLAADWKDLAQSLSECLSEALKPISRWLQETDWVKLGDCLAVFIANVEYDELATNFFEAYGSALAAAVSAIYGFIDDIVEDIWNYFADKIERNAPWSELGDDIKSAASNAWGWVTDNIFEPINKGFTAIIPEEKITGFVSKILPKAATGTIVSHATDLTVGEDGTEAVVPLEKHTEWLDVLASKLSAKTGGGGTTGGSVTFQFYLGGRKITEYVVKDINQIAKENGVCPINV